MYNGNPLLRKAGEKSASPNTGARIRGFAARGLECGPLQSNLMICKFNIFASSHI